MAKGLVIVESPAKAKTINKFLGKNFKVLASMGHVRDLPSKTLGVDVDDNFEPTYEVLKARAAVVKELKTAAKTADKIWVATDPDREGEAIGWHIAQLLDPKSERTQRVTFNEITQKAVTAAFANAGDLNAHKVDAQQTRRILDRIVGYKISPLLWKKVRRGLSAGRVQSVALKMVCDRERQISAFTPEEYWTVIARLAADLPPEFTAKLLRKGDDKFIPKNQAESDAVLRALERAEWKVSKVDKKERRRNPVPPFITSKLQQDAVRQLRFSVKKTMMLAQRLYEGVELGTEGAVGLITYMRTDSPRVSDDAITAVREYISTNFGPNTMPAKPRTFATKKSAQDAHEAIRPTSVERTPESMTPYLERDALKLYKLIWSRFIASQMNPAVYDQTSIDIDAAAYTFRTSGSVLKQKGFLAVYEESTEVTTATTPDGPADEEPGGAPGAAPVLLPELHVDQVVRLLGIEPEQHFTEPPPRYTEASLVKALEENGIGRPSTYASILSTIEKREYTTKEGGKFAPTELGFLIADLLEKNFAKIMDIGYTAKLEEELDRIEDGALDWISSLRDFHTQFMVDFTLAETEMRDVKREEIPTGETCEKCGKPMVQKFGRFGSFVACSGYPECRNTRETNETPEEAAPADIEPCEKCQGEMVLKRGRFGKFLACASYPKCKNTRRLVKDAEGKIQAVEQKLLTENCKECGSKLVEKEGRFGVFVACSNYPECKFIKRNEVGIDCPKCQSAVVEKRSRRGKNFYGCSAYPKCDWVVWNKPIKEKCPECAAPFLLERVTKKSGTTIYCATEGCAYTATPAEAEV